MRRAPAELGDALTSSHRVRADVDAWLAGTSLGRLPVVDGQLVEDAASAVPERLTVRVPRHDPATATDYLPTSSASALAVYGQRLRVARVVPRAGADLVCQLGWFRIVEWELDGDELVVEALGLLAVLDEAKLLVPTAPPSGSTFASELVRLVEGLLPVTISPALVDRAVPSSFAWDSDRLGAVRELADAWPARLYVDEDGTLTVAPPFADATDPAELTLVEGDERLGVVVSVGQGGTRDGIANAVVAKGEATDDPARTPLLAIAYDTDPASPSAWGGPYGPAPAFFSSPVLTTQAAVDAAAVTRLANLKRPARTVEVECVPDPRISAAQGTRVDVRRADGTTLRTRALAVNLPLTAEGGTATYRLAVL